MKIKSMSIKTTESSVFRDSLYWEDLNFSIDVQYWIREVFSESLWSSKLRSENTAPQEPECAWSHLLFWKGKLSMYSLKENKYIFNF